MKAKDIMTKLLSTTFQKGEVGSLENLRQAFFDSEFVNDSIAKKMVAMAHVACFSLDGREIEYAIDMLNELGDVDELNNLFRLCKSRGLYNPALKLKNILNTESYSDSEYAQDVVQWFNLYRDSSGGVFFIAEEDRDLIKSLIKQYPSEVKRTESSFSNVRKQLLEKLASDEVPVVSVVNNRENVDPDFREYCDEQGIWIVKQLQKGREGLDSCSNVYLVLDSDRIFKIYKELLNYNDRWNVESEAFHYQSLPELDFLPRCYGKVNVNGHEFLKLSVHYGQSLADYVRPNCLLSVDEARFVIGKIAEKLGILLEHNFLYLDLKPENILITSDDVKVLDLGLAKVLDNRQEEADIFLIDQRYAPPEWTSKFKASEASLVYQLGIIFVQLLTGKHPFILVDLDKNDPISAVLRSAWPSMFVEPNLYGIENELINRMLEKDPAKRPGLIEIANELKCNVQIVQKGRKKRPKKDNTVLFVARMGIPHKGHIEYISRFLEMGFYVKIAISKSYTITQKDPIPKWIVMKMVAQSLIDRGFSKDDFEFMLTPFYETDDEMKIHFLMMPEREDIVGVGSSNPEVWRLFLDKPMFTQKSVFGHEGEVYHDRSWGEIVRKAVRDNDYETFVSYAAKGVEKILSFSEIQKIYGKPEIEFIPGIVKIVLSGSEGEIVNGRVLRYKTLEESLVFHLKREGHQAEIIDLYSSETQIVLNKVNGNLIYERTEFDGKDAKIRWTMSKNIEEMHIDDAAKEMLALAKKTGKDVITTWRGVALTATKDEKLGALRKRFRREITAARK